MKLPVAVTGMIAHGHGDVRYVYYGLDIYPSDSNHTVGSIAGLGKSSAVFYSAAVRWRWLVSPVSSIAHWG
jgi:hypothetical protein